MKTIYYLIYLFRYFYRNRWKAYKDSAFSLMFFFIICQFILFFSILSLITKIPILAQSLYTKVPLSLYSVPTIIVLFIIYYIIKRFNPINNKKNVFRKIIVSVQKRGRKVPIILVILSVFNLIISMVLTIAIG